MIKTRLFLVFAVLLFVFQQTDAQTISGKFKRIKAPKTYEKVFFLTANLAYSSNPQLSYGVTLGQVKRFGWYASVMTNFKFKIEGEYECNSAGKITSLSEIPFFSGTKSSTRFSITVGAIARLGIPLYLYLGTGYGLRSLFWETENGKWIKVASYPYSVKGFNSETGMMCIIKKVTISAGISTINLFDYTEFKIGLGYSF